MRTFQAVTDLNSFPRAWMNFEKRQILRNNFKQKTNASTHVSDRRFDQLSLKFFVMRFSHEIPLYRFYTMLHKLKKWPKAKPRGGGDPAEANNQLRWICTPTCSVWRLGDPLTGLVFDTSEVDGDNVTVRWDCLGRRGLASWCSETDGLFDSILYPEWEMQRKVAETRLYYQKQNITSRVVVRA